MDDRQAETPKAGQEFFGRVQNLLVASNRQVLC
ncbi:hypothetical protein DFAR_2120007 [Desulfarculales bacterium]